jgi:hypothetical protein
MDIRRTLKLKPGQKVDKSILENESISNPLDNLRHYYDDDTIIEMLNTLAKNDANKTIPSAQNGQEMSFYQHGLDWKPKSMENGGWLDGYAKNGNKYAVGGVTGPCGANQIYLEGTGCIDINSKMYEDLYNSGKLGQKESDGHTYSWLPEVIVNSKARPTTFTLPSYPMPINRTDVIGRTPIEEIKYNQQGEKIHAKNVAENKKQFISQGHASTPDEIAWNKLLTKKAISGLPNVTYNEETGTTSAVNPNMTYTGEPANFMGEKQQHGYDVIMGGLEAAAYLEGAGALRKGILNLLGKGAIDVGAGVTEGVAAAAKTAEKPWTLQELPGLHLKSTMSDGAISKIVEPKTGLINTDQALSIIEKESGGRQKADLIRQALGENVPKKMDYNDFRKITQDQLIPLDTQLVSHSSNYGIGKIGYPSPKRRGFEYAIKNNEEEIERLTNLLKSNSEEPLSFETSNEWRQRLQTQLDDSIIQLNKSKEDLSKLPIENKTLILSNKNKFGRGSGTHMNPDETLGHIHFLRDAENPDVLTVTQIQSDAFQGTHRSMPKNVEEATQKLNKTKGDVDNVLETMGDEKEKFKNVFNTADKELQLDKATVENFSQKSLLDKNHQERYIQEIVNYAGERGDLSKIRLPTSETAAKIQNYEFRSADEIVKVLNEMKTENFERYTKIYNEQKKFFDDVIAGKIKGTYGPDAETILKKYSEQPKLIKKLYGVEPQIVTDAKGNTWYEFDIPQTFKQGKGEIKAFKQGGVIKDDRGQWDHPGEITEIGSNRITMQGVPYPVLGISDTGHQQMMYPGEEYKFKGKKVTEFPMAQNGKRTPIYTDDPRKVKNYNDSLTLYNNTKWLKDLKFDGSRTIGSGQPIYGGLDTASDVINDPDADWNYYNNINKNIKPISYLHEYYVNRTPYSFAGKHINNYNYSKESTTADGRFALYKEPVQPYKLEKPSLKRKPVDVELIKSKSSTSTPGLKPMLHNSVEQQPVSKRGEYRVSYYNTDMKDWDEKAFQTEKESDQFANEMGQRRIGGSAGNVTQTRKVNKKENGGWLSQYK